MVYGLILGLATAVQVEKTLKKKKGRIRVW